MEIFYLFFSLFFSLFFMTSCTNLEGVWRLFSASAQLSETLGEGANFLQNCRANYQTNDVKKVIPVLM